jgi:hypothetical protein
VFFSDCTPSLTARPTASRHPSRVTRLLRRS